MSLGIIRSNRQIPHMGPNKLSHRSRRSAHILFVITYTQSNTYCLFWTQKGSDNFKTYFAMLRRTCTYIVLKKNFLFDVKYHINTIYNGPVLTK